MVKQTQTIRWQQSINCLNVFDHFWGLALKGLTYFVPIHHFTPMLLKERITLGQNELGTVVIFVFSLE